MSDDQERSEEMTVERLVRTEDGAVRVRYPATTAVTYVLVDEPDQVPDATPSITNGA